MNAEIARPNVRSVFAAMFMAGLVRPRNRPEVDLSAHAFLAQTWWLEQEERRARVASLILLPRHFGGRGEVRILLAEPV